MQTVLPSEFKRLMVLMLEGVPHLIEDFHTSGTAQTRHRLHTRLRQLKSGHVVERVFAENERVPVATAEHHRATYSYAQGDSYVFFDAESFEELNLNAEQLGERRWFLKENVEYRVLYLDGKFIDVELPPQIALKIVETVPPVRGSTDSSWKEAKLETGLQLMVPLFITNGETIRIDTATKKYAGRQAAGE